jgi:hypothetical protein
MSDEEFESNYYGINVRNNSSALDILLGDSDSEKQTYSILKVTVSAFLPKLLNPVLHSS